MQIHLLALLRFPFFPPKALSSLCPSAPSIPHKKRQGRTNKKIVALSKLFLSLTFYPHLLWGGSAAACMVHHPGLLIIHCPNSPLQFFSDHSSFLFQFCEALYAQKRNSSRRNSMFPSLLTQPPQTQRAAYESLAVRSEIHIHPNLPLSTCKRYMRGYVTSAHHKWGQSSQSTLPSKSDL